MANPYHHALSSVKKWGGVVEDYIALHTWFDQSKEHLAAPQHRALRHHTQGIFEAEHYFGHTITLSTCAKCGEPIAGHNGRWHEDAARARGQTPHDPQPKLIPTRWIGEQHVIEDLGFIPTVADWLEKIEMEPWMAMGARRLSQELG